MSLKPCIFQSEITVTENEMLCGCLVKSDLTRHIAEASLRLPHGSLGRRRGKRDAGGDTRCCQYRLQDFMGAVLDNGKVLRLRL